MSAKKAAAAPKQDTFMDMIIKAIPAIKDRKGASRTAIATWIQNNCGKETGTSRRKNRYYRGGTATPQQVLDMMILEANEGVGAKEESEVAKGKRRRPSSSTCYI